MTQEHTITPPPELVQQWWDGTHGAFYEFEAVVTQAARWGADQQLLACGKYLEQCAAWEEEDVTEMYNYLRPKPPSLKEQALQELERVVTLLMPVTGPNKVERFAIIRRALEQLDD